jgi:hypothetical protein
MRIGTKWAGERNVSGRMSFAFGNFILLVVSLNLYFISIFSYVLDFIPKVHSTTKLFCFTICQSKQ